MNVSWRNINKITLYQKIIQEGIPFEIWKCILFFLASKVPSTVNYHVKSLNNVHSPTVGCENWMTLQMKTAWDVNILKIRLCGQEISPNQNLIHVKNKAVLQAE